MRVVVSGSTSIQRRVDLPLVFGLLLCGDRQGGCGVVDGAFPLLFQVADVSRPRAGPSSNTLAEFDGMDFVPALVLVVVAGVVNPASHHHEQIRSNRVRVVHVKIAERRVDVGGASFVPPSFDDCSWHV